MPDLATDDQRFTIFQLFEHFGIKDMWQMSTNAARILKIDYLADLRDLTSADADELIGELRRALAQEQVAGE
jgi:hypothetical protein